MKVRTIVAVLLSAGLLMVGAQAASAAWKTGDYTGTTSQNRLIQFKVTKKKVKFISSGFTADCGLNSETSGLSGKIRKKTGKFTAKDEIGATVVKGKLKGKRANGTLRFNYGACDTGKLTWKAKKAS